MATGNGSQGQAVMPNPISASLTPGYNLKKFDPDAKYIKKWIPELQNVPPEHLHQWETFHKYYPKIDYPPPIVNHHEEAARAKFLINDAKQKE